MPDNILRSNLNEMTESQNNPSSKQISKDWIPTGEGYHNTVSNTLNKPWEIHD